MIAMTDTEEIVRIAIATEMIVATGETGTVASVIKTAEAIEVTMASVIPADAVITTVGRMGGLTLIATETATATCAVATATKAVVISTGVETGTVMATAPAGDTPSFKLHKHASILKRAL